MLKFLRGLFGPAPTADPDAQRRFAKLLLTEVKQVNRELVDRLRRDPASVDPLLAEVERAYQMYADRVGGSPDAAGVFRDEAVRSLADGDEKLLEPGLSQRLGRP